MTRPGPEVEIFLPLALRNFANRRVHWRTEAAYRKRVRLGVALAWRAWGHRCAYSAHAPKHVRLIANVFNLFDDDGLRNACKPIVDGLVDARVIHSDGPGSGHLITYAQRIDRANRGVNIRIEEAPHG